MTMRFDDETSDIRAVKLVLREFSKFVDLFKLLLIFRRLQLGDGVFEKLSL